MSASNLLVDGLSVAASKEYPVLLHDRITSPSASRIPASHRQRSNAIG
jgi:hypothetical protein